MVKLATFLIFHSKIKDDISRMTSISISSQVTTKEPKTQTLKGDAVTKNTGLAQCPKLIRQVLVRKESSLFRCQDFHLKHHLIFLFKPGVLIGIWRGGLFFQSNYLSSFWHAGSYHFIFLAFGLSCPTHSTFWHVGALSFGLLACWSSIHSSC